MSGTNILLKKHSENRNVIQFTLSGVDVSFANAIRRTLLSDIPMVVLDTSLAKNKIQILANTSRLHNEILKQRLSCIPIHLKVAEDGIVPPYVLEIHEENESTAASAERIRTVTTKHFKLKNKETGEYLPPNQVRDIFPPFVPDDHSAEYFIDLVRLKPRLSEEIPGERIHLLCELSLGTARQDSMYNATATCAYGFTPDEKAIAEAKAAMEAEGKSDFEVRNWLALDAKRLTVPNSFDFVLETVGVYENEELVKMACRILIKRLEQFIANDPDKPRFEIFPSDNTLQNSYDVKLLNEDYTLGNMISFKLYQKYFLVEEPRLQFVGFKKMHPHDTFSLIRMSLTNATESGDHCGLMLQSAVQECIHTLEYVAR